MWAAFVVAAFCFAATIDPHSGKVIAESVQGGDIGARISSWALYFLPFNMTHWWTFLISLAGYVVLILDVALACAAADRHMRYNSLSPRGLFSSMNNNIIPSFFVVFTLVIVTSIAAVLEAGIMKATSWMGSYVYILGIIICVIVYVALMYAAVRFILWLPCYVITGFRPLESLSYAYALTVPNIKKLFLSAGVPVTGSILANAVLPVYLPAAVSIPVVGIIDALVCVCLISMSFIAYIDADGIKREDLKKY